MPSYAPHTPSDITAMLEAIGVDSVEALFSHLPATARLGRPLDLPSGMDEGSLFAHLNDLSLRNRPYLPPQQLMGGGLHVHYQPSMLDMIFSRSEFLTSYTPYQPEISQGTLQVLYEYQTMICELTGLDIANASSYDASTALGDALYVLNGVDTSSDRILISGGLYPQYREVLATYNQGLGLPFETLPLSDGQLDPEAAVAAINAGVRGVILQSPNQYGVVENPATIRRITEAAHAAGALAVMAADPLALALLVPPGEVGVDIAVGEAGVFGNTPNFGGPVCGYFACTNALMRKLPGRVVGQTVDNEGRRCYVLTLTAREQHIRREKATSNLCTAQVLNGLGAAVYLAFYGKRGIPALARRIAALVHASMTALSKIDGVSLPYADKPHVLEFVVQMKGVTGGQINCRLCGNGLSSGIPLDDEQVLITLNETHDQSTIATLVRTLQSFNETPALTPERQTAVVA